MPHTIRYPCRSALSAGCSHNSASEVIPAGRSTRASRLVSSGCYRLVGWIAANGQRVTDLLNDQDELRLWHPSPGPIVEPTGAEGAGLEPGEETGEWQSVVTEQLILAMPPEWRAARQLRLHRKLRRVALSAGPFSVTGNLHLSPTAETDPIPYEGRRFLPLTDAYILHNGEPPFEHVVSVVIVNTAHITQLVPLVTLA